ncbi:hypothetical protein SCA6_007263, partial [Theobroma cacao]
SKENYLWSVQHMSI